MNLRTITMTKWPKVVAIPSTLCRRFSGRIFLLIATLLGGLGLRLFNLATQPYWGDEAFAVGVLRHYTNFRDLMSYVGLVEYYPPLSFVALYFWSRLFGFSEFAMRFPSVIFGVSVIILTYILGERLFPRRRVSVIAAMVVAVLPMQIDYSQSVRPYIWYAFFGLLAVYSYWRYQFEGNRVFFVILYLISSTLGLYIHYSFFFILAPLASFWILEVLWRRVEVLSHGVIIWLMVHSAVFIAFYPLLPQVLSKWYIRGYTIFGTPRPVIAVQRGVSFFGEVTNQLVWMSRDNPVSQLEVFAILIFKLVLIVVVLTYLLRKFDAIRSLLTADGLAIVLLVWLYIVSVMLFLFSPLSIPYTQSYQQHLIFSPILLALLFGILCDYLKPKLRLLLLLLFFISIFTFVVTIIGDDSIWDAQYRLKDVAEFINKNYQSGDIVVSGYDIVRTDINYYLRSDISVIGFVPTTFYNNDYLSTRDTMGLSEIEFHFRIEQPSRAEAFNRFARLVKKYHAKRVWIVYFGWPAFADDWFLNNGWRKIFWSPMPLFPVDLYDSSKSNI